MRILVVNWQDRENPQAGGAETHLHETFGRLAARGHEVVVLCSGFDDAPRVTELDGIEVHRTGGRYTFALHARRAFERDLRARDFDVIVEDLNKVPLFTPRWRAAPVVPLVHHLFGWTAFREASVPVAAATVLLERPIPRVFRGLPTVAVSESTRDDLVRRGLRRDDIEVIPNGIDLERYTPGGEKSATPTLLYIGRLKRYKGIDLVLRAVRRLVDDGVDLRLRIAGRGDDLGRLRALTRRLDLGNHVEFPGFVTEETKLELLRTSWVHVLTSPKEGWGISNIEAAACGTPSVVSDAPGLRESVRDGVTGFLVPHGDIGALARRLATLIEDAPLRLALGEASIAWASRFSWEVSTERWETLLARPTGVG
ncbi:MAG: glycosyltransferase family 4 protein [Longimicrobiales bacterium]|nr:glycosyltransferase family 4 protein [Longimicrobiales bacterium]